MDGERAMISTHVLDTSSGRPAQGVSVALEVLGASGSWLSVARYTTDLDGRVRELGSATELAGKTCRLRFETGAYFAAQGAPVFFPYVDIAFVIDPDRDRYHVPLLLSPFGYSTYRGS
jgi:5-hydroxyisourate hydrolase